MMLAIDSEQYPNMKWAAALERAVPCVLGKTEHQPTVLRDMASGSRQFAQRSIIIKVSCFFTRAPLSAPVQRMRKTNT